MMDTSQIFGIFISIMVITLCVLILMLVIKQMATVNYQQICNATIALA
jgi:hypothetical protein